jgi:hypothetical protein
VATAHGPAQLGDGVEAGGVGVHGEEVRDDALVLLRAEAAMGGDTNARGASLTQQPQRDTQSEPPLHAGVLDAFSKLVPPRVRPNATCLRGQRGRRAPNPCGHP